MVIPFVIYEHSFFTTAVLSVVDVSKVLPTESYIVDAVTVFAGNSLPFVYILNTLESVVFPDEEVIFGLMVFIFVSNKILLVPLF